MECSWAVLVSESAHVLWIVSYTFRISSKVKTDSHIEYMELVTVGELLKEPSIKVHISKRKNEIIFVSYKFYFAKPCFFLCFSFYIQVFNQNLWKATTYRMLEWMSEKHVKSGQREWNLGVAS